MTPERIREIALANGFKLKDQGMGGMDLNPYVYDFAAALRAERDPGTVTVDAAALRQVLAALIGAEHEIRELQFTRSLGNSPIDLLVRQYNEQAGK